MVDDSVQTDIGAFHKEGCRFQGLPIKSPKSLEHEHCICDPDGSRTQEMLDWKRRHDRSHVLWQDRVWYPKEGDPVQLTDMSLRYKKNVLAFLERRAPALKQQFEARLALDPGVQGEHAMDAVDQILYETIESLPTTWLHDTPLVCKLEEMVRLNQDGPVD